MSRILPLQQSIKMNEDSNIDNEEIISVEATRHKLMNDKRDQCRICLESDFGSQNKSIMISPCKCTGSLKYVHESCLEEWISNIVNRCEKKVASGKAHIFCEICKSKIYFKTSKALTCKSKQKIIENFKENIKTFILLMLLLLTNLGFFSALLNYLLFVGFPILQSNNAVLVSLIIAGQVIFSIVALVTLGCIINKYFLSRKYQIFQITNLDLGRQNLSSEPVNALPVDPRVENQEKLNQSIPTQEKQEK